MTAMHPVQNTPLNQLFLAINHYISTGDHVGEGMANEHETHLQVIIPVNQTNPVDREDFTKFRSRWEELQGKFSTELVDNGEHQQFRLYTFNINPSDMDELAKELTKRPGPLGWGSMYGLIQKHNFS